MHGVTYPCLVDDGAVMAAQFAGIAPQGLPSTVLIDADQRVGVALLGAVNTAQLLPYLDTLLTEGTTTDDVN